MSAFHDHGFRSYRVHQLVSARVFRCLRFAPFVTAGDARLATQWSGFLLLWQDLHLQDVRGFSQRTAQTAENMQ